jgi:6-phosphogluconate dehydrogenase
VTEAVYARALTALKQERVQASKLLKGPTGGRYQGDRRQFIEQVRQALYASKICSYAQGYVQLQAAAQEHEWPLDYGSIALLWRGGCIIRARFLERIKEAFDKQKDLQNLLLAPYFAEATAKAQDAWRNVIVTAAQLGIWVPAFMTALAYYDGIRQERLPANLLQAQRDYFGAHTYQRTDREGTFHTDWIRERRQPK